MSLLRRSSAQAPAASTTALAQLIAGMSPNTWAQFTGFGTSLNAACAASERGGTGSTIFAYCAKMVWSSIEEKIHVCTQEHGASGPGGDYRSGYFVYDAAGDAWSSEEPPFPGDPVAPLSVHSYYMNEVDTHTGDVYHHRYGGSRHTYKRAIGGAWGEISNDNIIGTSDSYALGFHPSAHGGTGALLLANQWGMSENNVATDTWSRPSGSDGIPSGGSMDWGGDSDGGAFAYDAITDCCYQIGGSVDQKTVVRVSSSLVCTNMSDTPINCGTLDAGNDRANVLSGWAGQPMVLVGSGAGNVYEYDSGVSDAWNSVSTRPFTPSDKIIVGCAIPPGISGDYGAFIFVWDGGGEQFAANAYVWKPPAH